MKLFYTALLSFLVFTVKLKAEVKLPKLVADGMVLQRDVPLQIWGWADAQEKISIQFNNKSYRTTADAEGNWTVELRPAPAGGPFRMKISGENTLEINDIMLGEVWLCSGQSNMEIPMSRVSPLYEEEIATANNPDIRYFEVPKTFNFQGPQEQIENGNWEKVNRENIEHFSAVAYFFAKNLYSEYNVPIGLINSSLGGSPAESWISAEGLKKFPEYYNEAQRFKDQNLIDSIRADDEQRTQNWYRELSEKDRGIQENWEKADFDASSWQTMEIPGFWADTALGNKNGAVWFQKQVKLTENWTKSPVKLLLGRIVDADSVFVNGTFVGNTTYQYPPRRYEIPQGVLHKGNNTLTVKVINSAGRGGFVGDKPYQLILNDEKIELTGSWHYKLGAEMPYLRGQTFIRWKPGGLYNAMIAPLTNYKFKGVIWYQGESNTDNAGEYEQLFSTLINDWREKFNEKQLPFLYVQLPNFMEAKEEPGDSNWARLRDAQLKTLKLPKTGMAVAIDVGEWNDIHPLNKKSVGDRLAQAAKAVAYGENVVPGGPVFKKATQKDGKIILSFDQTGSGLTAKNGKLESFAIAGEDHKFVWAEAEIKGDKIIVSSPEVKTPVAVRYGWADNPENANLYNEEGFPASPFRTDDFED